MGEDIIARNSLREIEKLRAERDEAAQCRAEGMMTDEDEIKKVARIIRAHCNCGGSDPQIARAIPAPHLAKIKELEAEVADTKDDLLRRHKDAVDRFEKITALEAERDAARVEALEEAAQWHAAEAERLRKHIEWMSFGYVPHEHFEAENHKKYAVSIRALKEQPPNGQIRTAREGY
jgi:hypothetical protein